MTAEPTHTINQSTVRSILGKAAGGCGGALNSFFVILGDKCGLYPTGQYRSDTDEPIVHSQAPSIGRKRCSSEAADGVVHTQGRAIPGEDRATSVQRQGDCFYDAHLSRLRRSNRFAPGISVKSVKAAVNNVLVVDDDSSIRNLLAEELRYRGYSVTVARNGSEALDHLDVMTPDVIVLDLMMPVMDGWTFVAHYRDRAGRRCVPIVVVSAEGDLPKEQQMLGVTAFFRKPLDLDELANCIAQLAGAREASVALLSPTPRRQPRGLA